MNLVLLVPVGHTVGERVQVGLQYSVDVGLSFRGAEMGDVSSNRMSHVETPFRRNLIVLTHTPGADAW